MGCVIDTSVFAACERKGWPAETALDYISRSVREPLFLTAIVVSEIVEGIYRAKTPEEARVRRAFALDIFAALPVLPFLEKTAWIGGRIRGEQGSIGNTLPPPDSLIVASALEFNYAVVTLNMRDFERIPGLRVIPFTRP